MHKTDTDMKAASKESKPAVEQAKFNFMLKETLSGNPKKNFIKLPEGSLVMDLMAKMTGYTLVSPAQPPPETPLKQITQDYKSPDMFVFIKSSSLTAAEKKTLEAESEANRKVEAEVYKKVTSSTMAPTADSQKDDADVNAHKVDNPVLGQAIKKVEVASPITLQKADTKLVGAASDLEGQGLRFNFQLMEKPGGKPSNKYLLLPKGSTLLDAMRNMKGYDLTFPKVLPSLSTPIADISSSYDSPDIFIFAKRNVRGR